ncbi:MAG: RecQ family zinc-binding domain-containing protein [Polyangiaceae bacterium]
MPKKSKRPEKKAVARVLSTKSSSGKAAKAKAKGAAKKAAKRSARAPKAVKAKAKPKALLARLKQVMPKAKAAQVRPTAKRKAKPKQPQAKRAAPPKAKPKAVLAKPKAAPAHKARAARSVILPPKPVKPSPRALRLVVAPAPRAPRATEAITTPGSMLPLLPSQRAANAPAALPLKAGGAVQPALAMRARTPRAAVTKESWLRVDEAAARLGRSGLSDEQRVAIRAALEGHDSLVVLVDDERAVTCYQICALLLAQPTLVVSPLTSELKAQHEALIQRKIPAVCLTPELSGPERSAALARVAKGGSLLVLASPEALREADVRQALCKSGIALFAAEEAHCASDLAHEVRPSYGELGAALQALGAPPIMALTRVASAAVRRDICDRLGLNAPVTVQGNAVRHNLRIITKLARGEARQASLVRLVGRLELPGIVFCATPHDADSVYAALRGVGVASHRYHSGMTPSDRAAELLNFTLPGQRSVMVAVSAFAPGSGLPGLGDPADVTGFGRGAGKRDLRFVVHYQSPASIEQYVREIQRAGGDDSPATCVLLHESSHRSLHEGMLAQHRFRAAHLAELGRALESPAEGGRTVTIESIAMGTGQSRRTTDRLTALLADAGVVSRTGGWVRVLCPANELLEACRRLGTQLYALREQDGRRLAAVTAFAETTECKRAYLGRYFGEAVESRCGRCDVCSSELLASQESIAPQISSRRAVVQEFSVQAVVSQPAPASGARLAEAPLSPLTATMADFSANPRGGR